MILVDASVLVDYLRTSDLKLKQVFANSPVGICGATRAEVLHGARDPADRQHLLTLLDSFQQQPILESIWDVLGDHLATLRRAGLTMPFADVLVMTVGIVHNLEVWARDKHFQDAQKALPALKLFQEPP